MNISFLKNKRGSSLLEIIVYLAMFTVLSTVIVNSLLISMRLYKDARTNREFTEQGSLAMERISRSVRSASAVNVASSTLGTSPGVLVLTNGTSTTMFDVSSSALRLTENGAVSGNLTAGRISVSSLIFYYYSATSTSVKTDIRLTDSVSGRSESFSTTNILRNAY